jgi:isocitrate lyase
MTPKGEYKQKNKNGLPIVYEVDDVVTYLSGSFIATERNTYLDGLPDQENSPWEPISTKIKHTSGPVPHLNAKEGDEWFDTGTGILFKYVGDNDSKQWVEI